MKAKPNTHSDEDQIRRQIEERVKAVRAKDVGEAISTYAGNALMFDVVTPLQYAGLDKVSNRAAQWFSSFDGPIGYEVRDLDVAASGDVAYCHFLYRVNGTAGDHHRIDMWVRATMCFRKVEGTWVVTHEHNSVPFDPETGKALLNLKPA